MLRRTIDCFDLRQHIQETLICGDLASPPLANFPLTHQSLGRGKCEVAEDSDTNVDTVRDGPNTSRAFSSLKSRISMRHIRLLHALAQHTSLRKAAEAMHLTQPAVTKTLHEIEMLVGTPLFVRSSQGLLPNDFGDMAIRYANLIQTDLDKLNDELGSLRSGGMGTVTLGSMSSQMESLIAPTIVNLSRDSPSIHITVFEETSDHLIEALERGEIDVAVARVPQGWSRKNLILEETRDEFIQIACGTEHPARHRETIDLADLTNFTWIAQPRPAPLRDIHEQIFREALLSSPPRMVETSSTTLTVSLLTRSNALTLLPRSLIGHYEKMGILAALPVMVDARLGLFGLIWRRDAVMTSAVKTVINSLRTTLNKSQPAISSRLLVSSCLTVKNL